MNDFEQQIVNDLLTITAKLLDAARKGEKGRFVQELQAVERCASYARAQMQKHVVLDFDAADDDDL